MPDSLAARHGCRLRRRASLRAFAAVFAMHERALNASTLRAGCALFGWSKGMR
jgi:hypothetical protein